MTKHASLVLLLALCAVAQQPAAKQEVPDNISEHAAPQQPLPFSHKRHFAMGLGCQQCHTNPDPGAEMTFPAVKICMTCHRDDYAAHCVGARISVNSGSHLDASQAFAGGHAVRHVPRRSLASRRCVAEHQRPIDGKLHRLPSGAQSEYRMRHLSCVANSLSHALFVVVCK